MRRTLLPSAALLTACLAAPVPGQDDVVIDGPVDEVPVADDPVADDPVDDCELVAFSESFDQDGWEAARWDASDESEGGSLLAAGGRAIISSDGGADSYGWFATVETFDVAGRCLHVDVPRVFAYGDDVATEAYLGVYLGDEWIAIGQHRGQLCCYHERGVASMAEKCDRAFSPEEHARWRLRFEVDEVACDVAPATGDWTEHGRLPYGGPYEGSIELLAGTWEDVDEPGQVEFDDLNL